MSFRRSLVTVVLLLVWSSQGVGQEQGEAAQAGRRDSAPTKTTVRAADGVEIVCESRGTGDTALVFLHGWCGDRSWWEHQADAFSDKYRVVTVDQAGHGESGKGRKEWTVDAFGADVQAVVKHLGFKRVILVGHSMGGPVSLAAARRMPGTVVAVVGVDTLQDVEFKMPDEHVQGFMEAFEKDFKGTTRYAIGGMLPEKADPKLLERIASGAEKQDPKVAIAIMRELTRLDTAALLKDAKVPVRCVNAAPGAAQFTVPTNAEVNRKYADFKAVTMEGVGHFPMLERPEEFNGKLRDVLKEFVKQ
jgi:pimeloyl-ACP methyl ester carboxylesterase